MNIYPAILTDKHDLAKTQLSSCIESGLVHTVQIDIIDGYFVDNLTISPGDLIDLNFGNLEVDFHLLTQEPIDFVREIIDYKDDLPVRSIIAQIEQMSNQKLFIDEIRQYEWNAGFSLNIDTPISEIDMAQLDRINIVQLMSINAGFQGQDFIERIYQKIAKLRELMINKNLRLEVIVDGGVDLDNISKLQESGVSSVTIGSALWEANDFVEKFQELEAEVV